MKSHTYVYRWKVEGTSGCGHTPRIHLPRLSRSTGDVRRGRLSETVVVEARGETADASVGRRVGRSVVGARDVAMTDEATNAAERGSATTATRARREDVADEEDGFEKIALGVGAAE